MHHRSHRQLIHTLEHHPYNGGPVPRLDSGIRASGYIQGVVPVWRAIGRWLSEVLVPTPHEYHRVPDAAPCRDVLSCEGRRIGVVRWQGEVWVACRNLPA